MQNHKYLSKYCDKHVVLIAYAGLADKGVQLDTHFLFLSFPHLNLCTKNLGKLQDSPEYPTFWDTSGVNQLLNSGKNGIGLWVL